jgi:F0F1-type ATP synthase assembly protein I
MCLSLLCGWGALHFVLPLYLLGFVGAFAMVVVIGGPHGPDSHIQGVVGGIVYVIVNAVFFFYIFRFFADRLLTKRERQ